MAPNVFREAQTLLRTVDPTEMTEEERSTVTAALIPLGMPGMPFPEPATIDEGLELLSQIVEDANEEAG